MFSIKEGLARLFGLKADTSHWMAVKEKMERDLDASTKVLFPVKGGDVLAYFENGILISDKSSFLYLGQETLKSTEPVGKGKTAPEALIDLFDQLTKVSPESSILKITSRVYGSDASFEAVSFKFEKGSFVQEAGVRAFPYHLLGRNPDIIETFESNIRHSAPRRKPV